MATAVEQLADNAVLIAGGGPVGLLVAYTLAHYGVRSVLVERNDSTTRWPKMDLTNGRSMEILRRLGLADDLRKIGVPAHIPQPVLFTTGLWADKPITKWVHPSVNEFRNKIQASNDGTQPLEPWQRVSQVLFEAWLKDICAKSSLIELRYGWKVESVVEEEQGVNTTVLNQHSGQTLTIRSQYVAGCDGASSKVRQSLGIPLDGGPVPSYVLLVHFKSKDLTRLHKQGQFWHIFFLQGAELFSGSIIAQNEVDTWTTHMFLPLGTDEASIDSHEAIYSVLGGAHGRYPINVDEILVRSAWRPNISMARQFGSSHQRVFLAGDAAHQLIPTGGYGMNTGIGDAYDLGWKLAATINGQAGPQLLASYEAERRPVAMRNAEQSGVHMQTHMTACSFLIGQDLNTIHSDSAEGRTIRKNVHDHYQANDGENVAMGIEMGYRYQSSVILQDGDSSQEPPWDASRYIPTSWPGGRPPHVFLTNGTPIFDTFHPLGWTLVTFAGEACGSSFLVDSAAQLGLPVKHVALENEENARKLWERDLVLIRPDQHVCWRGITVGSLEDASKIWLTVTGRVPPTQNGVVNGGAAPAGASAPKTAFSATTGLETQVEKFELEKMSAFQQ